ncbi:hypothetical protein O181_051928 [Austropuccinia psidii MF-1]|uniref:Uncharacterized protein n=1 Tax=Austropuccinia psidii MF-1 TaxID=1389203 RepID=A0A9Q3HNV1_9BASI|nr:hypothetical protein [Austropuccinia psidii MF-1]
MINNHQLNNQGFRPKDNFSPQPNKSVPYVTANNVPNFTVKFYYFSEEGHSTGRCNEFIEDQHKKWALRQGLNYLYPNWERVPNDGKFSPEYLVREFQKEQQELKRKLEYNTKEEEQKKKDK